jgi:hypothetical protein
VTRDATNGASDISIPEETANLSAKYLRVFLRDIKEVADNALTSSTDTSPNEEKTVEGSNLYGIIENAIIVLIRIFILQFQC